MNGSEQVGEQVLDSRCLADAAEVVLKVLEESAILRLVRAARLLSGELRYLFLHLLHTDPQVSTTTGATLVRILALKHAVCSVRQF